MYGLIDILSGPTVLDQLNTKQRWVVDTRKTVICTEIMKNDNYHIMYLCVLFKSIDKKILRIFS